MWVSLRPTCPGNGLHEDAIDMALIVSRKRETEREKESAAITGAINPICPNDCTTYRSSKLFARRLTLQLTRCGGRSQFRAAEAAEDCARDLARVASFITVFVW